jgi:hypothetical protein
MLSRSIIIHKNLKKSTFVCVKLHPLLTTGFAPVAILLVLNIRISRGISSLNRKRQISIRRCDHRRSIQMTNEQQKSSTNQRHYKEIR